MPRDYDEANAYLAKGKDKDNRPLANNTRLIRRDGDTIAVRLYSTDIVLFHSDGTQTVNLGGWDTVTTRDRIDRFSAASVASAGGLKHPETGDKIYTAIWHGSDPSTPPRVQKCRKCHGSGELPSRCGGPSWLAWCRPETCSGAPRVCRERPSQGVECSHGETYNYFHTLDDLAPCEHGEMDSHGVPCEHGETARHATEPCRHGIYAGHPDGMRACYNCDGSGRRDYGSRQLPTPFDGPKRVDSDGRVLEHLGYYGASAPAHTPANTIPGSTVLGLKSVIPDFAEILPCPTCREEKELNDIIVCLNDRHRWTRTQIADWLDTLDLDLSFNVPA